MKNFELLIGIGLGAAIAGAAFLRRKIGSSLQKGRLLPLFRGRLSEGISDTPVPPRRVRVPLRNVFVGSLLFPSEKRTAKEERPLQRVLLREVRKKVVQISFGRSRLQAPPLHALIFIGNFYL